MKIHPSSCWDENLSTIAADIDDEDRLDELVASVDAVLERVVRHIFIHPSIHPSIQLPLHPTDLTYT